MKNIKMEQKPMINKMSFVPLIISSALFGISSLANATTLGDDHQTKLECQVYVGNQCVDSSNSDEEYHECLALGDSWCDIIYPEIHIPGNRNRFQLPTADEGQTRLWILIPPTLKTDRNGHSEAGNFEADVVLLGDGTASGHVLLGDRYFVKIERGTSYDTSYTELYGKLYHPADIDGAPIGDIIFSVQTERSTELEDSSYEFSWDVTGKLSQNPLKDSVKKNMTWHINAADIWEEQQKEGYKLNRFPALNVWF